MRKFVIFALVCVLLGVNVAFAVTSSSGFKVYGGQVSTGGESVSSASFNVNGGVNAISGTSSSSGFGVQQGAPVSGSEEEPVVPAPSSSSGGGSIILIEDVDLDFVDVFGVSSDQAFIDFGTNRSSIAYIQYGVDSVYDLQTAPVSEFSRSHQFALNDLRPGTRYNFTIHLKDKSGDVMESISYAFVTLPEILPPVNVSNFSAKSYFDRVVLTWNNSSSSFEHLALVKSTVGYPSSPQGGQYIYGGVDEIFIDTDVEVEERYYYSIFVFNSDGEYSSGAIAQSYYKEKEVVIDEGDDESAIEETSDEGETSDEEELNVEEEEIIPATPLPIPEDVVPSEPVLSKSIDFISMYNLVEQRMLRGYEVLDQISENIDEVEKKKVLVINDDFLDDLGRIQRVIFEKLTVEEKEEIEEIIKEPLPKVFDKSSVVQVVPISVGQVDDKEGSADWHVFADTDSILSIPASIIEKPVEIMTVTLKSEAYVMRLNPETNSYEAAIHAPSKKGEYEMLIQVIYEDNTYEELYRSVLVDPYGYVYATEYDFPFNFKEVRLQNAEIILYSKTRNGEWTTWPAHLYDQFNPQLTNSDGEFVFMVPRGEYYIEVSLEGYSSYKTETIVVKEKIVNVNVKLTSGSLKWSLYGTGFVIISLLVFVAVLRKYRYKK